MRQRGFLTILFGFCCLGQPACSAPRTPVTLDNPDLSGKIPAIKRAASAEDAAAIEKLVAELDSDDPAIRFYAIEGLRRITGQTLDYRYYEDERQRRAALMRWRQWLADEQGGAETTRPTTGPATYETTPDTPVSTSQRPAGMAA